MLIPEEAEVYFSSVTLCTVGVYDSSFTGTLRSQAGPPAPPAPASLSTEATAAPGTSCWSHRCGIAPVLSGSGSSFCGRRPPGLTAQNLGLWGSETASSPGR